MDDTLDALKRHGRQILSTAQSQLVAVLLRLQLAGQPLPRVNPNTGPLYVLAVDFPPRTPFLVTLHPIITGVIGDLEHLVCQRIRAFFLGARVLVAELWNRSEPSKDGRFIWHALFPAH